MKYLSLFSGIGGFELGIQQAYEENCYRDRRKTEKSGLDARVATSTNRWEQGFGEQAACIGYSEIDKYAIQIYEKHFNHKNYGDITKISEDAIPDFDLICGGFPCQAFSIAGKRGGFNDTRGTLFFDIARIVRAKRPRLLWFENVKGLLSHDRGRTFDTIIRTLDELGYDIQWQVLNSKNHGVPQNRERVFIIGHLRGTPRPKVFPFREDDKASIRGKGGTESETKPASAITTREGGRKENNFVIAWSKSHRTGKTDADKRRHNYGKVEERIKEDEFNTLSTGDGGGNQSTQNFVSEDMKIRRLTPTECERLQGFPDGWTEGVSDTQRYKCLGNAVTVNVIRDIAEKLL